KHLIFGYRRMCGRCKICERMLDIGNEMLELGIKKIDVNFYGEWSKEKEIMCVGVLLVMGREEEIKRKWEGKGC
ncbi:thioredoxin, partial [Staphylococcus epidermidis]|uniref:thioredoxin n=1 Tax=Staphylococcus epidermidis TaxID=1282 RepID=UPI0011A8FA81